VTTAAVAPRIPWRLVTVMEIREETSTTSTLLLDVPDWPGHLAGQHVDVRLTAADGYQAERSYSIASAPEDGRVALTIERLSEGEVSTYLCGEARVGDRFEIRGPIGGYFVWRATDMRPLFLVAGGSGIVPLMSMLRHRAHVRNGSRAVAPTRLLYSSRSWADVIYRDELEALTAADPTLGVTHTITRDVPPEWQGLRRRIDRAMLEQFAWPVSPRPVTYVCGPTALVESVATTLVEIGHEPSTILTERFGPTG